MERLQDTLSSLDLQTTAAEETARPSYVTAVPAFSASSSTATRPEVDQADLLGLGDSDQFAEPQVVPAQVQHSTCVMKYMLQQELMSHAYKWFEG